MSAVSKDQGRSVLVTGASGLLGQAVCEKLSKRRWRVFALSRSNPEQPCAGVDYLMADLASPSFVEQLPTEIGAVIHLAQSARFRDFPRGALDVLRVNVVSTAVLLDYSVRCGATSFVFTSSGGVYADSAIPVDETSALHPIENLGGYLGSKLSGEILVQSYSKLLKTVILRPFFIYGPGQDHTMLIPRLIQRVAAGESISINGDNGLHINPIYIDDAANAVTRVLDPAISGTFNIAGPEVISLRDVVRRIGSGLGIPPHVSHLGSEDQMLIANISKMSRELIAPSVDFNQGLMSMLGEVRR